MHARASSKFLRMRTISRQEVPTRSSILMASRSLITIVTAVVAVTVVASHAITHVRQHEKSSMSHHQQRQSASITSHDVARSPTRHVSTASSMIIVQSHVKHVKYKVHLPSQMMISRVDQSHRGVTRLPKPSMRPFIIRSTYATRNTRLILPHLVATVSVAVNSQPRLRPRRSNDETIYRLYTNCLVCV